ncbi:hypothetical protein RFI_20045 [Reticulomyxa filosa]|uniref:Carbohydrate kinase PfkB domain-containing protein n=1 Tax=Reticulomyxa filosa TaxID=46433 RepID=X6MW00_RETFI|nr:hypothetical protein RFI_20045 [Reticulomyxa filosa]|eukprot:ETO17280.1 hypothetical protein RFI_20045 [Reticulomyxa filosa]
MLRSSNIFKFSDEVQKAFKENLPIVALESTIITHGMPFPENYDTAQRVEQVVRDNGAIPATIAIIKGKIHVGLSQNELLHLSEMKRKNKDVTVHKCSRRDLSFVLSQNYYGSTTVAATMYIAHVVGIEMFVTGGIGGVHRGVNDTFDISADLTELGRTPVTVICAGIKSILDIPKTLEYMETQGVTVTTLGQKEFPAFFTSNSGCLSPLVSQTIDDVAKLIKSHKDLKLTNGILVGVPVPKDKEAQYDSTEKAIQKAIQESVDQHIIGRDVTPFLLQKVNELTEGKSLQANIALIQNNAKIGAQIASKLHLLQAEAAALCRLSQSKTSCNESTHSHIQKTSSSQRLPVIIGGMARDVIGSPSQEVKQLKGNTSNPGIVRHVRGGVARNVAECLARLGHGSFLISAVGNDLSGRDLVDSCQKLHIDTNGVYVCRNELYPTASCVSAFDDDKRLHVAVADLTVVENAVTKDYLTKFEHWIKNAPIVVVDSNLDSAALQFILQLCGNNSKESKKHTPVWYIPASVEKASRAVSDNHRLDGVTFLSSNASQLWALLEATNFPHQIVRQTRNLNKIEEYAKWLLGRGVDNILVHIDRSGTLLVNRHQTKYFEALPIEDSIVKTINGAGNNLAGGTICGLLDGKSLTSAIEVGLKTANTALLVTEPVNPSLSREMLKDNAFSCNNTQCKL